LNFGLNRFFALGHLLLVAASSLALTAKETRPNILFIAVDDLRPELGVYGAEHMVTPNIERFTSYSSSIEKDAPHIVDLPIYLRRHGYYTVGNGKTYHGKHGQYSWSEKPFFPEKKHQDHILEDNRSMRLSGKIGRAYEATDADDSFYADGEITDKSLADLEGLAAGE